MHFGTLELWPFGIWVLRFWEGARSARNTHCTTQPEKHRSLDGAPYRPASIVVLCLSRNYIYLSLYLFITQNIVSDKLRAVKSANNNTLPHPQRNNHLHRWLVYAPRHKAGLRLAEIAHHHLNKKPLFIFFGEHNFVIFLELSSLFFRCSFEENNLPLFVKPINTHRLIRSDHNTEKHPAFLQSAIYLSPLISSLPRLCRIWTWPWTCSRKPFSSQPLARPLLHHIPRCFPSGQQETTTSLQFAVSNPHTRHFPP